MCMKGDMCEEGGGGGGGRNETERGDGWVGGARWERRRYGGKVRVLKTKPSTTFGAGKR